MLARVLTPDELTNQAVIDIVADLMADGAKVIVREKTTAKGVTQYICVYDPQLYRYIAVDAVKVG